jgi:hypothetical protein
MPHSDRKISYLSRFFGLSRPTSTIDARLGLKGTNLAMRRGALRGRWQ